MTSYLWSNGAARALLFAVLVGAAAGSLHRRRTGDAAARCAVIASAWLSIAAIVALTLARYGLPTHLSPQDAVRWAPGWERFTAGVGSSEEVDLNVALFVPAGLAWTLRTARPAAVLLALGALSGAVEALQGLLGLGTADVSDLVANTSGAFVGCVLGALAWSLRTSPRRRRHVTTAAGGVAAMVAIVVASGPLADQHLRSAVATAQAHVDATTLLDYRRWDAAGEIGARVFAAPPLFADGDREDADKAQVRYPATFLGHRGCVVATWTTTGVRVRGERGAVCTAFWG